MQLTKIQNVPLAPPRSALICTSRNPRRAGDPPAHRCRAPVNAIPMLAVIFTSPIESERARQLAASIRTAITSASEGSSRSSQRITNSSPDRRASVSPGRSTPVSRSATAISNSIADTMAVGVVDPLEIVQIDEKHRRGLTRAPRTRKACVQALQHQHPVRKPRQRIVQRGVTRPIRGILQIRARLRVDQIRRGDISQRLRGAHLLFRQRARRVPIQVKRANRASS